MHSPPLFSTLQSGVHDFPEGIELRYFDLVDARDQRTNCGAEIVRESAFQHGAETERDETLRRVSLLRRLCDQFEPGSALSTSCGRVVCCEACVAPKVLDWAFAACCFLLLLKKGG